MKITWFHRDHRPGVFSIEEVFNRIRPYLPEEVELHDYVLPSSTWPARLKAIKDVKNHAGEVNHITGDVHFLAFGLPPEKTIITVHDIGHFERDLKGIKKSVYGKLWFDWPLNKADYITAISSETKKKLIEYFNITPDKIRVIYNPAPDGFEFRPKEDVPDKPKILQIGGMKNKNVERLIEAVKDISCELILIRKPDDRLEKLMSEANIDYNFYYDLSYEQVYQKYIESDILYFASTYEGFGVPIIEAQSVGRPVLTSNLEPMIDVGGQGAHFVDPYSINEIKSGIYKIINDNEYRTELIYAGRKNVKRFEPKMIAAQYFNLYMRVLRSIK